MKSFSQLIAHPQTRLLRGLQQHAQQLQHLQKILQMELPTPLNQHCYLANLREQTLIIHTDSALWAMRLRYLSPELIVKWHQDTSLGLSFIEKIEVKVRPR
jgi:hypothetical protein